MECLANHNIKHGLASKKKTGKQDKRYTMWCSAKKRAIKNKIEFSLKIEDIPEIPEFCPVLGIRLESNTLAGPLDSSPSLDRINSLLGYTKNNIRIVCNRVNRIKSDSTLEELKSIVKDWERYESI